MFASSYSWNFTSELSWPNIRGKLLLREISQQEKVSQQEREKKLKIESCKLTAGHLALCLLPSNHSSIQNRIIILLDAVPCEYSKLEIDISFILDLFTLRHPKGFMCTPPPVLCSRHDSTVIAMSFMHSASNNLYFMVSQNDGNGFIWKWNSNLFQWLFLNKFCFLENENLQWTKPVCLFACTASTLGNQFELSWYTKYQGAPPKLCFRNIDIQLSGASIETISIGSSFGLNLIIKKLISCKSGLWMIDDDVFYFRSAATKRSLKIVISNCFKKNEGLLDVCIHDITDDIVFLSSLGIIRQCKVTSESPYLIETLGSIDISSYKDRETFGIAVFRHIILLINSKQCFIHDIATGSFILSLPIPCKEQAEFWMIPYEASSLGIWSSYGIWRLHTPNPIQYLDLLCKTYKNMERNAFKQALDYGQSMKYTQAKFALEVLSKKEETYLAKERENIWLKCYSLFENPALLLGTIHKGEKTSDFIIDDVLYITRKIRKIVENFSTCSNVSLQTDFALDITNVAWLTTLNVQIVNSLQNWAIAAKDAKTKQNYSPPSIKDITLAKERPVSPLITSRKIFSLGSLKLILASLNSPSLQTMLNDLEQFLLEGIELSDISQDPCNPSSNLPSNLSPSHLLFHEERKARDQSMMSYSNSKHIYFEILCRLYWRCSPSLLPSFVLLVHQYCPRIFTLDGHLSCYRSHAERSLFYLQPLEKTLKADSLRAYAQVMSYAGRYVDAIKILLELKKYSIALEFYKEKFNFMSKVCQNALYCLLLENCVKLKDAKDIEYILDQKPLELSALYVCGILRKSLLERLERTQESSLCVISTSKEAITVGKVRKSLFRILSGSIT